MARRFRRRHLSNVSSFFDERLLLDSTTLKSLIIINTDKRCQLPSCYKTRNPQELSKHHWNYQGRTENPLFFPRAIHLLCLSCHDRTHKIAGMLIFWLEILGLVKTEELIKKVSRIFKEPYKNVRFVLVDELKRAGIVEIRKGRCKLMISEEKRIRNIKKYLEIHDPKSLEKVRLVLNS